MRFSEIVKTKDLVIETRKPGPTSALPLSSVPKEKKPEKDFTQELETAKKELETRLQKEFLDRIESMQSEFMRMMENKLSDEQKRSDERIKGIEGQREDVQRRLQDIQRENQQLREAAHSFDAEQKGALEEKDAQLRNLQKKVWELDEQLKSKEGIVQKPEEVSADESKAELPSPPAAVPVSESFVSEEAAGPEIIPILPERVIENDVRERYQSLVHSAEIVFEQAAQGHALDISPAQAVISEVVDSILVDDTDFINLTIEAYPTSNHFSYHAANCAVLSVLLGMDLRMKKEQLKELGLSALLHDLGLVNIRESLDYPGQLTKEIKAEVLKHPERAASMLTGLVNDEVTSAVHQHHEISNGTGYPQGLAGENIHLYARIINVADSFEAMTHERPYRSKPFDVSHAIKEMVEKGRGLYDRDVMKALLSRIGLYPVHSLVELSNKQIARVVRQNRQFPLSPVVQIEFDEEGNKLKSFPIIDLTKNQLMHILGPLNPAVSVSKERLEMRQHSNERLRPHKTVSFWEYIPFVLVTLAILLLIYLILKI